MTQFEFNKFFVNPQQEIYIHIIQSITQIQIWKVILAVLAICFDGCLLINIYANTISQIPCGYLLVKISRLVYEQVMFKFAGWLSIYVLATIYLAYECIRDYKINKKTK